MARVALTAAARADLDDALTWYRTHAPHIVPAFRGALRAVVMRIGQNPLQFPLSSHTTRKASMHRFPYLVILREVDETCFVVAIFHMRRDPRVWEDRIS